ncbi:caspase family protein [Pseudonocardia sp. D17]|uniref:caspase family protein n=1 Tax=Pseudonocardia sp. D17 TaxID=882661 RepID=UPI002B3C34D4|nr:hypothetical protein PSD17_05280 [Pseudonocardia sp. D17]
MDDRDLVTPAQLTGLRPHLVNLTRGTLSDSGLATTSAQDVDRIFAEHLPAFVDGRADVPVVLWAHGGLVDEASGLRIAERQVRWWLDNGVYPIFFAWEAGFSDALHQLLGSFVGGRGLDAVTDRLVEWTVRHLGGRAVWGSMKSSAERASAPDGGARLVAQALGAFVRDHPGAVRLHAVGHSAGAILHRHFVPVAVAEGAAFDSLSLLAPALRVDAFHAGLAPLVGHGVAELALITMDRDHERADVCAVGSFTVYHDSLLLLIRAALEDEELTPILGLEESVHADPWLWSLFGPGGPADVRHVWAPTAPGTPPEAASTSTTHGGFDDDPATMEGIVRRITGRLAQPYPVARAGERAPDVLAGPAGVTVVGATTAAAPGARTGARRALCVGINAYPDPNTLSGCVADAESWAAALVRRGFETETLLDGAATRQAIVDRLGGLVGSAEPGDVIVFQYAGHGTTVADVDGDELFDQALCPVDFASGALLVDDDLRALFADLPDQVNLTCFLDCCHSATATRRAYLRHVDEPPPEPGRPRFILADAALEAAHRAFRQRTGATPAGRSTRGTEAMREITFSACLQSELAFETGGRGDYSRIAVPLLDTAQGTNQQFQEQVLAAFGRNPRQTPFLDSAPSAASRPLLAPRGTPEPAPDGTADRGTGSRAATVLRAVADLLD